MKRLFLLLFLTFSACGHVDYEGVQRGEFSGSLFVMWIGEGDRMGDGEFVYVPNPRDPLTFTRKAPDGSTQQIRPQMMYTDGGSIPRAGQFFNGFSPWGYAPAYMIHDWLFVARHCNLDGTPTEAEAELAGIEFHDSAIIIAEAIKTLAETGRVRRNDVAGSVISSAVAGPISRKLWNERGACEGSRVSDADRAAAQLGIPGARLRTTLPPLPPGETLPQARIVGVFEF